MELRVQRRQLFLLAFNVPEERGCPFPLDVADFDSGVRGLRAFCSPSPLVVMSESRRCKGSVVKLDPKGEDSKAASTSLNNKCMANRYKLYNQ